MKFLFMKYEYCIQHESMRKCNKFKFKHAELIKPSIC